MSKQAKGLSGSRAAIHWDWQNVRLKAEQIESFINFICPKGSIIESKSVYADWSLDCGKKVRELLFCKGFDCIDIPTLSSDKNRADRKLIERCEKVLTDPEIDTVILISGDGDFKQLVCKLKQAKKTVIVVSRSELNTSVKLKQKADYFYDLNQIASLVQRLSLAA